MEDKLCNVSDANALNDLSANPSYTCSKCGLQAHSANALCSPMKNTEA